MLIFICFEMSLTESESASVQTDDVYHYCVKSAVCFDCFDAKSYLDTNASCLSLPFNGAFTL